VRPVAERFDDPFGPIVQVDDDLLYPELPEKEEGVGEMGPVNDREDRLGALRC
jgi:hypothetical protein